MHSTNKVSDWDEISDQVPMIVQGVQEMTKATTWMIDIFRAFIAVLVNDFSPQIFKKKTCVASIHGNESASALPKYFSEQRGGRLKVLILYLKSLQYCNLCLLLTSPHRRSQRSSQVDHLSWWKSSTIFVFFRSLQKSSTIFFAWPWRKSRSTWLKYNFFVLSWWRSDTFFFVRIDRSSVFTMGCVSWRKFLRKQEEIKLRKLSPWYKGATNWRRFLLIPFVPNFHNWGNISVPHFPHFDIEQILPIRYVRVSATFSRAYISWGGWRWWWRVERRRSRSCTMCSRRPSSHRGCNEMVFHGQGIFLKKKKHLRPASRNGWSWSYWPPTPWRCPLLLFCISSKCHSSRSPALPLLLTGLARLSQNPTVVHWALVIGHCQALVGWFENCLALLYVHWASVGWFEIDLLD